MHESARRAGPAQILVQRNSCFSFTRRHRLQSPHLESRDPGGIFSPEIPGIENLRKPVSPTRLQSLRARVTRACLSMVVCDVSMLRWLFADRTARSVQRVRHGPRRIHHRRRSAPGPGVHGLSAVSSVYRRHFPPSRPRR